MIGVAGWHRQTVGSSTSQKPLIGLGRDAALNLSPTGGSRRRPCQGYLPRPMRGFFVSTTVMSACWPLQMPATAKAVLISLADNSNDEGYCWPSIAKICERTCFKKTAVIDAITWLETEGFIRPDRSNGRHTTYGINLHKVSEDVKNRTVSRTGTGNGPVRLAEDRYGKRTKPVRETDTNRQEPSLKANVSVGTRLATDWVLPEEWFNWAVKERPEIDAMSQGDQFRDYWLAQPGAKGRKADWQATWRNWIRNARAPRTNGYHAPVANNGAQPAIIGDFRDHPDFL